MHIAIVGGGSVTWAFGFLRQFVRAECMIGARVTLMDIDPAALDLVAAAGRRYNAAHGSPLSIDATTDLDRALDGADYVLVTISTGGFDSMRHDLAIPERYGIWHTVGDTTGPGGWSRAVRNIPVFAEFGRRMRARCPDAWMINFSNPLTVLTRTPHRESGVRVIGMCPGVEGQARMLAKLAVGTEDGRIDYACVGVDHASWFTLLFIDGVDVLAKLVEMGYARRDGAPDVAATTDDPHAGPSENRANFALWREYGYMPCVPDRHTVENHPWFIANDDGNLGGWGFARTSIADREKSAASRRRNLDEYARTGEEAALGKLGHGDDPVLPVIESLEGRRSFLWGSNYRNVGQMPGAPENAVVETRVLFDAAGAHPLCSPVPEVLRPLVLPMILRQEAMVEVALRGTFGELVALVASDPLCARLSPGRCRDMVRELMTATREWVRNPRLLEF